MNRHSYLSVVAVAVFGLGFATNTVCAQGTTLADEVSSSIATAEAAVTEARLAIEAGKKQMALISQDSPMIGEITEVLTIISESWATTVSALDGAKASATRMADASKESTVADFALLSKVNARVALSGASVVRIGLSYIDAIAENKTESLAIVHSAMQDAVTSFAQVQVNYERVKSFIVKKYIPNQGAEL